MNRFLHTLAAILGLLVVVACAPARAEPKPAVWIVRDADSEMLIFGSIHLLPPGLDWRPAALDEFLPYLRDVQAQHAGVIIEEKPFGAAIHFREAPDAEATCRAAAVHVAASADMRVLPGKMVFEIKPADGNKGTAILAMMNEPAFANRHPVFIGDDVTDEYGFVAVRDLGGAGILVGPERETAAAYRLKDVDHVHRWLARACEELA